VRKDKQLHESSAPYRRSWCYGQNTTCHAANNRKTTAITRGRYLPLCVVLPRMRRAAHRHGCVLTRYGCIRLAWDFATPSNDYPALEVVDAANLLRTEDVQVDREDLVDRLGLRSTPDDQDSSPAERRTARYFVNVFDPWTSRELVPGLQVALSAE